MRFAIVFSVLLHVSAVMLAYLALPDFRESPLVEVIVPIEILTEAELAEETEVPEMVEETEAEPEQVDEPEPEPVPVPVEPEPEPEPLPEPEEVIPPLPEEEEPVEPEVEEEPQPEPEPEPVEPEPENDPNELNLDDLESALRDLTPDEPRDAPREASDAPVGERNQDRVGLGERLTASEMSLLRARMVPCWNTTSFIGAPEAEKLLVTVEFNLNPDGSISGQPRIMNMSQIQGSGNPFWAAAGRAALNAVLQCEPYDFLPSDKYETWREVEVDFDPTIMAGF